jgi:hypothetical protein
VERSLTGIFATPLTFAQLTREAQGDVVKQEDRLETRVVRVRSERGTEGEVVPADRHQHHLLTPLRAGADWPLAQVQVLEGEDTWQPRSLSRIYMSNVEMIPDWLLAQSEAVEIARCLVRRGVGSSPRETRLLVDQRDGPMSTLLLLLLRPRGTTISGSGKAWTPSSWCHPSPSSATAAPGRLPS